MYIFIFLSLAGTFYFVYLSRVSRREIPFLGNMIVVQYITILDNIIQHHQCASGLIATVLLTHFLKRQAVNPLPGDFQGGRDRYDGDVSGSLFVSLSLYARFYQFSWRQ